MKKSLLQYLTITFSISYACFGMLIYARLPFTELVKNPVYAALLALGCLAPLIAAGAVYVLGGAKFGGVSGLWNAARAVKKPKAALLIILFLALHYGFAVALRVVGAYGESAAFFKSFPFTLVLLGTQEIGWRMIVQPALHENKGFWKSSVATGLLQSLWFLPLLFIPGFVVHPDFYIQFTICIATYGLLQTTLYKQSGSILYCVVFGALFFSLTAVFPLLQNNTLLFVAIVDVVIAMTYNSRFFKENNKEVKEEKGVA